MSSLFFKNYVSYTSDISSQDTRYTNCNQLFTPKHKNAPSVNTLNLYI